MSSENTKWRYLSNHTQVLLCIVADLTAAGVVEHEKIGRRNRYRLNLEAKMRHDAQSDVEIKELLNLLEASDFEETG